MIEVFQLTDKTASQYSRYTYQSLRSYTTDKEAAAREGLAFFGASIEGEAGGMLVSQLPSSGDVAWINSVFVEERFRRRGIGEKLIEAAAQHAAGNGFANMSISYHDLQSAALEGLLGKCGWDTPTVVSRHYRIESIRASGMRWIRRMRLPKGYRILPWSEILWHMFMDEARVSLTGERGYKSYYSPLHHESVMFKECCFALLHEEEVIGWSIIDRGLADTMVIRSLYIRERYRNDGLGLALAAASIRAMLYSGVPYTVIQIRDENDTMKKVARSFIAPLQPTVTEFRQSGRNLCNVT